MVTSVKHKSPRPLSAPAAPLSIMFNIAALRFLSSSSQFFGRHLCLPIWLKKPFMCENKCPPEFKVHSTTFPSLHLRYSSFSNPFIASPTSQLILQPFFRFSYVTGSSRTSPGEPSMLITEKYNFCGRFTKFCPILF